MSESSDVEFFLSQAGEREKEYGWLVAAEFYRKAMGLVPQTDFLKLGQIHERIGYGSFRAAMQAESVEQFRERMHEAVANYEKANDFYERLSGLGKTPRMLRCDAMIVYLGYWIASEAPEKKRLLDECWQRTKEALKAFEEAGDSLEYGKTYHQLSSSAYHLFSLEWDFGASPKRVGEALEYGEKTITLLSNAGEASEIARAYAKTFHYLSMFGWYFIPEMDEKEKYYQKSQGYWQKANGFSEEAALLELLCVSDYSIADFLSVDAILVLYERALSCAEKTKDKYLIGTAMDMLAYANFWKASGVEDPDKRTETYRKALQYAEDAKHQFSSISYVSPRSCSLWTGSPHAEYYQELALWETDLKKRRDLLEKAVTDGTQAVKLAESTGYPEIVWLANHVLSKALVSVAQTENRPEEKKRLLEKALDHRNETIRISSLANFFSIYWDIGWNWNYLADLKAELSNVESDSEKRKNMLQEAISNKERGLQLIIRVVLHHEKRGVLTYFSALGGYLYSLGELLNRLYGLTHSIEHQRKAMKTFEEAAESFQKLNLFSRVAECYWKVARGYDTIGEHLKAAENFALASSSYTSAAKKIPQLKDFYQEHAVYMDAWSEIEKARHHHGRQEYGIAKEHYEKAATAQKSLKQWSYLAPNYAACAQVERAEQSSRMERSEEAITAFNVATKLFNETKKFVQTRLSKIEDLDEKQMATSLINATDLRHEYCTARIALEEAKILDRKGDHYSSSEKYGSAIETLEKMTSALESEQDQKETRFIISLSRAWQKMTQAEAEAAPALYMEASQLFEEAKGLGPSEKAKMLALGHSRFCRALEAGTKFADTREATLHAAAIKYLESAANYYVKADFQNASEYAKATGLLFDAYTYMDNAKREIEPEKKAKLCMLAEKVLQRSADSYMKAEYPGKKEHVLKLLETVKEERELAVSLTEVLHAPIIVSTTALPSPTPAPEKAVGLEKFEHAEIHANMIAGQRELKVGDNLDLEIELVNTGKGPALLTKITEVFPEGFEIIEKPEVCRVEDGCLSMKGKRLDPLKTEEVRLVLKPNVKGVFPLRPTILYLDENGRYRSHEPEPVTITVKELGIKGWLKGER